MPEATVLYTVTAVVVAGLAIWVAAVLKTVKEPWARPTVSRSPAELVAGTAAGEDEPKESQPAAPALDADSTAKATPVALGNDRKSATSEADAEAKDDGTTS